MSGGREYSKPVKLVIAHRWSLSIEALSRLARSFAGVELVACARSSEDLLPRVEQARCDVLVMDFELPHGGDPDFGSVIRRVRAVEGAPNVVVMSMPPRAGDIMCALHSGATGFLLRDAGPEALERAIRTAALGNVFLCQSIISRLASRHVSEPLAGQARGATLTASRDELNEIMREMHVHDIDALINQAIDIGIVSADH